MVCNCNQIIDFPLFFRSIADNANIGNRINFVYGYNFSFDYGNGFTATATEKLTSKYSCLTACSGLINMNQRLYDPVVGRFLAPDPIIQDPTNSQNYNKYSYALNNPLKYVDITGMKYTYNWHTGTYQDKDGNNVNWGDVLDWLNSSGGIKWGWHHEDGFYHSRNAWGGAFGLPFGAGIGGGGGGVGRGSSGSGFGSGGFSGLWARVKGLFTGERYGGYLPEITVYGTGNGVWRTDYVSFFRAWNVAGLIWRLHNESGTSRLQGGWTFTADWGRGSSGVDGISSGVIDITSFPLGIGLPRGIVLNRGTNFTSNIRNAANTINRGLPNTQMVNTPINVPKYDTIVTYWINNYTVPLPHYSNYGLNGEIFNPGDTASAHFQIYLNGNYIDSLSFFKLYKPK